MNAFKSIDFDIAGVIKSVVVSDVDNLSVSGDIDPGSWFLTLTPLNISEQSLIPMITGYPSENYFEVVLERENIVKQQNFMRTIDTRAKTTSFTVDNAVCSNNEKPIHICIISTDPMDGVKQIWINQIQSLNKTKFKFSWVIGLSDGNTLRSLNETYNIREKGVSLYSTLVYLGFLDIMKDSPFNGVVITESDVAELISEWDGSLDKLYREIHERYLHAEKVIENIYPLWCRNLYLRLRNFFTEQDCNIIVYGNNVNFNGDVLIVDVASVLGIPTVAELGNLDMHPSIVPDVVVAPSNYALQHESIRKALILAKNEGLYPRGVVISPGVNLTIFDPFNFKQHSLISPPTLENPVLHPGCTTFTTCFSVGWIGQHIIFIILYNINNVLVTYHQITQEDYLMKKARVYSYCQP